MRIALALALALLAPRLALADESAADKAAADALFSDGKRLMDAGSLEEACAKLEESYKLSVRLGTLLNLATCHEKQGKTASAWAEFNEAMALAKKEKRKDREQYAQKHAADLEKKLAKLTLTTAAQREDVSVEIDGRAIGSKVWGTPLPVDPGKHELAVKAPGKKTWTKSFEVKAARTAKIDVPELEAEATSATPPATRTEERETPAPEPEPERPAIRSGPSPLAYVALGVGVVGVGIGSYFGLRTFSKKNEADDHCGSAIGQPSDKLCDQTGVDLREQAKTSATISTISFAVGAVGIGAGIVLLVSTGGARERALYVRPAAGPRAASIELGGSF